MQPYPDTSEAPCTEVGVEPFFTIDHEDISKSSRNYLDEGAAKRICAGCPVQQECLNWALHHERYGIWGGTNPREREILRIKKRITVIDPMAYMNGFYDD